MLRGAIEQRKWSYENSLLRRSRKNLINPTINYVSELLKLNEKQKSAFSTADRAFLDSFPRAFRKYFQGAPLRMYVDGIGGTGKSRIV